jgi:hypothetical protein
MPIHRRPPGVPYGASTTYVQPDYEPPPDFPGARQPAVRVRIVPNETLLPRPLGAHLGELVQIVIDEGADFGVSVETDTSDRTRPNEGRGGASPIEAISLIVLAGAAGLARRQLERLADRLFDRAVEWVLRHRGKEPPAGDPISVTVYGPDGEELKRVLVPQGEGDTPPVEPQGRGGRT